MQFKPKRTYLASEGKKKFVSVMCLLPVHTEERVKVNIECPGFFQIVNQWVKEYS